MTTSNVVAQIELNCKNSIPISLVKVFNFSVLAKNYVATVSYVVASVF